MSYSLVTRTLSAAALMALATLVGAGSCSATSAVDFDRCTSNAECRAGFGPLAQCNVDTGLCDKLEVHPRCESYYPPNLFDQDDEAVSTHKDTIILGSMFDQTPDVGDDLLIKAAELAVIEANDAANTDRGVDGRLFGIVHCRYDEAFEGDVLSEDEATREIADWLGNTLGVAAIVGPGTSSTATATFETLQDLQVPIVSPSATSEALSTIDGVEKTDANPGQFWRTVGADNNTGTVMVGEIEKVPDQVVKVVHIDDSYGNGLASALSAGFSGDAELIPYTGENIIPNVVFSLANEDWDVIVFIGASVNEVNAFITAAGDQVNANGPDSAYGSRRILLADAAANSSVLESTVGNPGVSQLFDADNIRVVVPSAIEDSAAFSLFRTNMSREFMVAPGAESYSAQTYDAAWLALYGIAWAYYQESNLSGPNVSRGLRKLSDKNAEKVVVDLLGWSTIKDAFAAGSSVDITASSGELDFDPSSEETLSPLAVKRITADPEAASGYSFETIDFLEPGDG